jgi:hypothetical protein
MPPFARNILAVVAGVLLGGIVNGLLIALGPHLVPPPPGVDVSTAEGLAKGIHLFTPRHFIIPFFAHALGTFAGAAGAYFIAATHKQGWAYAIGVIFLCGGIAASFMIPAPGWFVALDLIAAYLPMAWLAVRFARIK